MFKLRYLVCFWGCVNQSTAYSELIWKDKGKIIAFQMGWNVGKVFVLKVSQDVLLLSLWQETEAFSLMKHFFEVMLSDCAAHLPVCTGQATSTSFSEGAPRELHTHQNFIKGRWKQGGSSLSFVCFQCPVSQVRVSGDTLTQFMMRVVWGGLGLVGLTRVSCSLLTMIFYFLASF